MLDMFEAHRPPERPRVSLGRGFLRVLHRSVPAQQGREVGASMFRAILHRSVPQLGAHSDGTAAYFVPKTGSERFDFREFK